MPVYIVSWAEGTTERTERVRASRDRVHHVAATLAGHDVEVIAQHPDGRELTRRVPRKYRLEIAPSRPANLNPLGVPYWLRRRA